MSDNLFTDRFGVYFTLVLTRHAMHHLIPTKFRIITTLSILASFFISTKLGNLASEKVMWSFEPEFLAASVQGMGPRMVEMLKGHEIPYAVIAFAMAAKLLVYLLVAYACTLVIERYARKSSAHLEN